jgi:hypothetical protein
MANEYLLNNGWYTPYYPPGQMGAQPAYQTLPTGGTVRPNDNPANYQQGPGFKTQAAENELTYQHSLFDDPNYWTALRPTEQFGGPGSSYQPYTPTPTPTPPPALLPAQEAPAAPAPAMLQPEGSGGFGGVGFGEGETIGGDALGFGGGNPHGLSPADSITEAMQNAVTFDPVTGTWSGIGYDKDANLTNALMTVSPALAAMYALTEQKPGQQIAYPGRGIGQVPGQITDNLNNPALAFVNASTTQNAPALMQAPTPAVDPGLAMGQAGMDAAQAQAEAAAADYAAGQWGGGWDVTDQAQAQAEAQAAAAAFSGMMDAGGAGNVAGATGGFSEGMLGNWG